VFSKRYPALLVGMALTRACVDAKDRIRYERAWVCRNGGCDYRELLETCDGSAPTTEPAFPD
jgi:hypothetical protein